MSSLSTRKPLCVGRYECHSDKQFNKIKKDNPYVCFILQINETFVIDGFLPGKKIPNKNFMLKK